MKALGPFLAMAALLAGCAQPPAATTRQLFDAIAFGMSRAEVDARLGAPVVPPLGQQAEVWYLPPPELDPAESPFAPGTIGVTFSEDGKVIARRLNPQFRER